MPYFLDGNNLIGLARKTSRPDAEDRAALLREVSDRLRRTQARVVVFFDGSSERRPATLGSVSVRESGSISADEAILREIARAGSARDIVVVTADAALARRARDAGARSVSPPEFWSRFGGAARGAGEGRNAKEGAVDVADWERWFEDESNRGK